MKMADRNVTDIESHEYIISTMSWIDWDKCRPTRTVFDGYEASLQLLVDMFG